MEVTDVLSEILMSYILVFGKKDSVKHLKSAIGGLLSLIQFPCSII